MKKQKKSRSSSGNHTCLISLFSIFFIAGAIIAQVSANKITDNDESYRSSITIFYYDKVKPINSFEEISEKNIDISLFREELTTSQWNPRNVNFSASTLNDKCERCGLDFQNPSADSTSKDLIMTFLSGYSAYGLGFVSSLRSANSQASIFVFADDSAVKLMTQRHNLIKENCNVQIISIGDFSEKFKDKQDVAIHLLYHEFLRVHRNKFDRVLIFDMQKSIFQSDPFTIRFNRKVIGIGSTQTEFNEEQLSSIELVDPHYDASFYDKKAPINTLPLYGSVDGLLMFYGILLRNEDLKSFNPKGSLFAYLNYYYHNGFFSRHGMNMHLIAKGEPLTVVVDTKALISLSDPNRYDIMYTMYGARNPPSFIHIQQNTPVSFYFGCSYNRKKMRKPKFVISKPKPKKRERIENKVANND